MPTLQDEILSQLPMLTDEVSNRSPQSLSPPPTPLGQMPATSDLGLRFLSEVLGSEQATDIAKLLKLSEGDLENYRTNIQSLQLTALQMKILGSIDDYKLANAPLKDLVAAFKTLKDKELVMSGKPTEIVGLAGYLQILERDPTLTTLQATYEEATVTSTEPMPNL